jgi:hypothetical protein
MVNPASVVKTELKDNYKMEMEFVEKTVKTSTSLTQKPTILLALNAQLMKRTHGKLFVTLMELANNAQIMKKQI